MKRIKIFAALDESQCENDVVSYMFVWILWLKWEYSPLFFFCSFTASCILYTIQSGYHKSTQHLIMQITWNIPLSFHSVHGGGYFAVKKLCVYVSMSVCFLRMCIQDKVYSAGFGAWDMQITLCVQYEKERKTVSMKCVKHRVMPCVFFFHSF